MLAGAAAHVRYTKKRIPQINQNATGSPRRVRRSTQSPQKNSGRRGSAGPVITTERPRTSSNGNNNFLTVPLTGSPPFTRKRSGSVPVIRFTLAVAWSLKPDYIRALKITWDRLCDVPRANCRGILGIMERVFEKFESKDKHIKEVFYQAAFVDSMADTHGRRHSDKSIATLRDHIHFFVSLISQVIHSLEKPATDIFEHIDKIGAYHYHMKKIGFNAQMWDTLGVLLVDAIVVQDCVRGFPEACRSWTLMVAALIDRLRSAKKQYGAPVTLRRSTMFHQPDLPFRCPSPTPRCPASPRRRGSMTPGSSPMKTSPLLKVQAPPTRPQSNLVVDQIIIN
ncbi:unnamed protein product [Bursaphelenchus okinawaensis]|uniref:Globin family profile domain-containing protein n=1 Tax=Bursaphelenchus okinawaensis TaxID=465554 RepID=A0A811LAZ7_9BILA|nr:unnamed protein product [Bursaphelenchus okinawaensis]CAG9120802.1 unnamed protein product [Bursaphelenchus okinawaensis]